MGRHGLLPSQAEGCFQQQRLQQPVLELMSGMACSSMMARACLSTFAAAYISSAHVGLTQLQTAASSCAKATSKHAAQQPCLHQLRLCRLPFHSVQQRLHPPLLLCKLWRASISGLPRLGCRCSQGVRVGVGCGDQRQGRGVGIGWAAVADAGWDGCTEDGRHCRPKRRLHGWCGAGLIAARHSQRAHFSRSCSALPCSVPSPPAACPAAAPSSLSLAGALHPNVRIAAARTTNSSLWGRQGLLLEEAGRHIGHRPSWGAPGDPTAMREPPRLLITAYKRLQAGPGRAFLPRHDAGPGGLRRADRIIPDVL